MAESHPENQHSSPKTGGASKALPANPKQAIKTWLESAYLSSDDGNCGVPLSIRDFINYRRYETRATADFTTEMLDWALETIERPSNTVIAPVMISHVLYGIGTNQIKDDGSQTVQQQFLEYYKALEGKRFVFLLVNNGFKSESEAKEKENWVSRSGPEKERARDRITTPRFGGNWSFIVIDTQSNTASYIDDKVRVENQGKRGHKISHIDINGPIAGNVLCGFDTFMQRKKGQLQTGTLKWVPRQSTQSQQDQHDAGSCGPYVWKTIGFILESRSRTLNGPGGLKGFFSKKQKGKVRFDLYEARRQIQQQLQLKRERKEASTRLQPYNLTPSTILEFLTPEFLRQIDSGSILKTLLDILEPPAKFDETFPIVDGQAGELALWKSMQLTSGKFPDDWTEDDKERIWKEIFSHLPWKNARLMIEKHVIPSVREEEWRKRQEYVHKIGMLSVWMDSHWFWDAVWSDEEKLRRGYNIMNGLDPDHPDPKPPEKPKGVRGSGNADSTGNSNGQTPQQNGGDQGAAVVSSVPAKARPKTFPEGVRLDQLPNFATDNVNEWFGEIEDLMGPWVNGPNVHRALMHRTYKGSFKNESREDLIGYWSQNPRAFNRHERMPGLVNFTPADIAQRMDDYYFNLNVPLFANLPEDEIEIWTSHLAGFRSTIATKNESAGSDRTRGLLHRLFVGEFAELRAEGNRNSKRNIELLEAWRTHDPLCSKKDFPTAQAAVDQLEKLYGTESNLPLPFLRESPLYWPLQRSIRELREKRKRGEESPGELPGQPSKKTKTTMPTAPAGLTIPPKVRKKVKKRSRP